MDWNKREDFYGVALEKGVPEHIIGGLERYVFDGLNGGGFLTAVLSNDLRGAFNRADDASLAGLHSLVKFLYWNVPSACWGSPERVKEWRGFNA